MEQPPFWQPGARPGARRGGKLCGQVQAAAGCRGLMKHEARHRRVQASFGAPAP